LQETSIGERGIESSEDRDTNEKASFNFKDILFSEIKTLSDEMIIYL
jgi:hypothetical protein